MCTSRVKPWRLATTLLLVASLVACSSTVRDQASAKDDFRLANAVSMHAIGLVGTQYRYGGNTPDSGFDCSGLIGYVFRESAGMVLPRSTSDMANMRGMKVATNALRVGDLVLFGHHGRVDHVGIYVGEERFVHAPSTGGTVRLDSLASGYWKPLLIGGRRPLN
ncbi:MAG: C40 family peptidase [Pseudomarimonas sp.]